MTDKFATYVIHYSKLIDRYEYLHNILEQNRIRATWVTEKNFIYFKSSPLTVKKIFGLSEKKVGMDLGVNSRSLETSRRHARIQGWVLYCRSMLKFKNNLLTTGSLPPRIKLEDKWIEHQHMNITALKMGLGTGLPWILILEDDAIPIHETFSVINKIINVYSGKIWINLNSGAGLHRTSTDPIPDNYGLYRVRPASARCTTGVLISRDLAVEMLKCIDEFGIPEWLPADFFFQALLRKCKAVSFWQEPETIIQGSESGAYRSNFR